MPLALSVRLVMFPNRENIVKEGTFLYDDCVECDICIVCSAVRYGSGDSEDLPEIENDVDIHTYYLWFGSTIERGKYNAGGGGYSSLAEAMAFAESRPGFGSSVQWKV